MSNSLDQMKPGEIIKAIRDRDLQIIKKLVIDGVKNKKIWTQDEVAEMVGVHASTVSRWVNGN